jgi:hypothetical protein
MGYSYKPSEIKKFVKCNIYNITNDLCFVYPAVDFGKAQSAFCFNENITKTHYWV